MGGGEFVNMLSDYQLLPKDSGVCGCIKDTNLEVTVYVIYSFQLFRIFYFREKCFMKYDHVDLTRAICHMCVYWRCLTHNLKVKLVCSTVNTARYLFVCVHNSWNAETPVESRGNKLEIMAYVSTQPGRPVIKYALPAISWTRAAAVISKLLFLVQTWRICYHSSYTWDIVIQFSAILYLLVLFLLIFPYYVFFAWNECT